MKCKNYFCIYWKEDNCVLREISLDIQGNCEDCIYININKEMLDKERERAYQKYKIIDCKYDY